MRTRQSSVWLERCGSKMRRERRSDAVTAIIQQRIRTFSRIEKVFYSTVIVSMITLAISIIYLESRNMQFQQEITALNNKIAVRQTELDDAKQEVNELTRQERVKKIAEKAGLQNNRENIREVE